MGEAREEDEPGSTGRTTFTVVPNDRSTGNDESLVLRELLTAVQAYRAAVEESVMAAREVLAAGNRRDAAAEARDDLAAKRERDRDLAVLLDVDAEYGVDWPARRAVALDRERAKQDRTAARLDRMALADQICRLVRAGGVRRPRVRAALPQGEPPSRSMVSVARVPRLDQEFTGTVFVGGLQNWIRIEAASWEEAVSRLHGQYGPDCGFVLRSDGARTL